MRPVAFTAWLTGAQSGTKRTQRTPPVERVRTGAWALHQSVGSRNALTASPQPTGCQGQRLMCLTGQGQGQKHSPAMMRPSRPALQAAGAAVRATPAAWSGREGRFPSYSTGVQWGLKTGRKRPRSFSCRLKAVCWPPPERSMQSEATMARGDSPYWAVLLHQ